MSGSSAATGGKVSTLDLTGKGRFTILTGIGGEGWVEAAKRVGKEFGIDIAGHVIGPRQDWQDLTGDWANAREVRDSGIVLVRPDQHVAWRREAIADDPAAELRRVLKTILGQVRSSWTRMKRASSPRRTPSRSSPAATATPRTSG